MPLYDWACKVCGAEAQTIVPMSESDVPPSEDEHEVLLDPECGTCAIPCHGTWEKVILTPPHARRGENWGGSKGNW